MAFSPCIPFTRSRKLSLPYDRTLYRQRHRIENAFSSAICIAAFVTFWL